MNGAVRDVSVVICCYADERFDDVLASAASVQGQTSPPAEIVVVVDNNPALLARIAAAAPSVTTIPNRGRPGLADARNAGIAASRGAIVAFLDDDAVAEPDWLERLGAPYADERVVGVGGAVLPAWDTHRPRWFPEEFDWVVGCSYRGLPERPAPVRNLLGANMSFRRGALEAVGGFSPAFGRTGSSPVGNCEDTEVSIRVRRGAEGGVLLYEPRARVRHRVPMERTSWRYFRRRCFAEGLSKATLADLAGWRAGLSTERRYTARVLPRGVARGLRETLSGDPRGVARSSAIVAGLALAGAGYSSGRARAPVTAATAHGSAWLRSGQPRPGTAGKEHPGP